MGSDEVAETWEELLDRWIAHDWGHEPSDPPCDGCRDIDRRIQEWVLKANR